MTASKHGGRKDSVASRVARSRRGSCAVCGHVSAMGSVSCSATDSHLVCESCQGRFVDQYGNELVTSLPSPAVPPEGTFQVALMLPCPAPHCKGQVSALGLANATAASRSRVDGAAGGGVRGVLELVHTMGFAQAVGYVQQG